MKVAVNKCYGGFGLSNEAIYQLIQMNSELIDKVHKFEWRGVSTEEEYVESQKKWSYKEKTEFKDGFFREHWGGTLYKDDYVYHVERESENRSHPDMISVVEKLGEEVNGQCAKIEITEIPDGVDYRIEEYDGQEWVAEIHRTW